MGQKTIFPAVCIALGFPDVESLLAHARAEYDCGERFLEFRLDYLASPERGVAALKKFLTRYPDCTILATCRRRQNQGRFTGSIEEQIKVLEAARLAGAQPLDLPLHSAQHRPHHLAHSR